MEKQDDWIGQPSTAAGAVNTDAARKKVESVKLNYSQSVVFKVIKAQGLQGATCGEVAKALDVQMHTISPRFGELRAKGLVMIVPGKRLEQKIWRAVYVDVPKPEGEWF